MKKALAILMVLALVASAATAEITFGAWGRGLFVPVSNSGASGAKSFAENKASWGGAPRIGFTIAGNSDNVGFVVEMKGDGGAIGANDQQFIWVKPMDMVKLSLGRVQDDTLRGNAAFGSWNWNRAFGDGATGEDFTFSRLSTGSLGSALYDNKQGLIAALTPVENLFVGVAVRDINNENAQVGSTNQTAAIMNRIQAAFGYTIADVGQIRAQIIRNPASWKADGTVDKNLDTIEIAFKYTGMENLYVDAGFRMWSDDKVTEKKQISIYGNYKMDALTAHASTRIDLNGKMDTYDASGDMGLYVGAGIDYALDGGVAVAADVRYTNEIMDGSKDAKTTVFAGVTKGFSNGLIGAGFEVAAKTDTGYSIPVRFEYWF